MRSLKPDEIECRVNIINGKGLSLLLYKNARTDMNILDEVYPDSWACEYREIKGNLFCGISVLINNEWVIRWDCGVESREDGNGNEKKGEASDSFKRAGTKWGIGRELYTAPKLIWIKSGDFDAREAGKDKNGKTKYTTYDTFSVKNIEVKDGNITALTIVNDKTQRVVYVLGTGVKPAQDKPAQAAPKPSEAQKRCTQLGDKLGITPAERKRLYEESGRSFEKLQTMLEAWEAVEAKEAESKKNMEIF